MPSSILQIIPSFNAGGVERVTLETVTGLAHSGLAEHHIASAGGQYVSEIPTNVTHHILPLTSKNPFKIIVNAWRLHTLIKQQHITIAHARSRAPAWSALWACRMAKVPFITTYHGTYAGSSRLKKFYNSIMARGDRVVAISKFILNHIKQTYPELSSKVAFIPEGIDTHRFNPMDVTSERIQVARSAFNIPEDATVFLLPGRLTRWKGQAWFLKSLQKIASTLQQKNVYIILLGDAQGREAYYAELTELTAGLFVHFKTSYDDLPALYALADIVFSCSLDPEAFGRVTAEALSMGRPFIGTNHGGTVELTNNGAFGTLVTPNIDSELIKAITEILDQPHDVLIERGENARAHICDNYSIEQMLRLTQQLYESVL
ncbi:MAG: glycosyltransferase family 4 protein [Candidatus Paracaedibacteraceae bacterium]|nr:glycosyltransferase family 4 protein [Candidatus Paracaedibacteraceae bacterium]